MDDRINIKVLIKVYDLLPLTDCGKCDLKTCKEFAEKLLIGEKRIHDCEPATEEASESITLILEDYFR